MHSMADTARTVTGEQPLPCTTAPDLFVPDSERRRAGKALMAQAKVLCAGCPRRTACLREALAGGYEGVWGGTTTKERQKLRELVEARRAARQAPRTAVAA